MARRRAAVGILESEDAMAARGPRELGISPLTVHADKPLLAPPGDRADAAGDAPHASRAAALQVSTIGKATAGAMPQLHSRASIGRADRCRAPGRMAPS